MIQQIRIPKDIIKNGYEKAYLYRHLNKEVLPFARKKMSDGSVEYVCANKREDIVPIYIELEADGYKLDVEKLKIILNH